VAATMLPPTADCTVRLCLAGLRGTVRQAGITPAGGLLDVPVSGAGADVAA
jgi:hypothetical protein